MDKDEIVKKKKRRQLLRLVLSPIRYARAAVRIIWKHLCFKFTKVNKQKVLMTTFQGGFSCNPKYIYEEIKRQNLPWEIVWITEPSKFVNKNDFPEGLKLVPWYTMRYYYELATSRVWIANALTLTRTAVTKRKNQIFIQTMHGSLGIKRLDEESVNDKIHTKAAKRASKMTDYLISNSTFENMVYKSTVWGNVPILEYGHPRSDVFFLEDETAKEKIKSKVFEYFNLPKDAKIVLYAPTFADIKMESTGAEKIDRKLILKALEKKHGGNWYFITKMHPRDKRFMKETTEMTGKILDGNRYPDIQELMLAIDIGITDYSSWIYDYVLTRKEGFIFAPDLDTYDDFRGFYYPIDETPFPISKTNAELIKQISSFNNKKYQKRIDEFLVERGCFEKGDASKRTVDKIKELMEK